MREILHDELKNIQIGILDYFVSLCEKNGLRYWLDYGTLIGAIRHHGYIPWDDDIDVAMLREDYDKLIEICKHDTNKKYKLCCVENDALWMYSFGKMIDQDTILYEFGESGVKMGVYIDIFVYDNAPLDEKKRKKAFDMLDHYGHLRKYQLPLGSKSRSPKRPLVILVRWIMACFLPRDYFTRKIVSSAKKYREPESDYVCDLTMYFYFSRWMVEKKMFYDLIDVDFEGKKYKAPREYDRWLRLQYGDYMKIPSPEEQAKARHKIKAYYKTETD